MNTLKAWEKLMLLTYYNAGTELEKEGQIWTIYDEKKLKDYASKLSTELISRLLQRTPDAIYEKASELGISLMPKD